MENKGISNDTQRLSLVFPIFLYGAETWYFLVFDRRRVEAFEIWVWFYMLHIPWIVRTTNTSIFDNLQIGIRLSLEVYKRILHYFNHIISKRDSLDYLIISGLFQGNEVQHCS